MHTHTMEEILDRISDIEEKEALSRKAKRASRHNRKCAYHNKNKRTKKTAYSHHEQKVLLSATQREQDFVMDCTKVYAELESLRWDIYELQDKLDWAEEEAGELYWDYIYNRFDKNGNHNWNGYEDYKAAEREVDKLRSAMKELRNKEAELEGFLCA